MAIALKLSDELVEIAKPHAAAKPSDDTRRPVLGHVLQRRRKIDSDACLQHIAAP